MSLLINNRCMPEPMVKNEDDEVIIDLECTELPVSNGPLDNWHKQVMTLIRKCYMALNETSFEELLKFYKRLLSEQVNCLNNETMIKEKILFHLSLIDNLYIESKALYVYMPNYFDYLIDILAEYANLEMKIIKHLRKRDMNRQSYVMLTKITASKICKVLSIYLKHSEEHIMHTLLKLRYEKKSVSCKDVMNKVYLHFLINLPFENLTDRAFCRNYLVLENWKSISNSNQYEIMDKMLTEKFMQDADYINRNETLRIIKAMKPKSTSSLYSQIMDRKSYDEEAYFDFIKKNDDIPNMSDAVNFVSLEDDNSSTTEHDWESPQLFRHIGFEVSNNSSKEVLFEDINQCRSNNIFENDVEPRVNAVSCSNRLPSLICLTDDDSDIEEIIYFNNHKETIGCNGEEEPIICIDLDEESSNDCIAVETANNNNSNPISTIDDDNINGARGIIMQQGASSEKDSDFEDTSTEKISLDTERKDSATEITTELKRTGEAAPKIIATTKTIGVDPKDNNFNRKNDENSNLKDNEEILISEVASVNVEVVQQTMQEDPAPQIENNANSVDQTYGNDTALNKNEERTTNGKDRFVNTVCDTPSVSPHGVHEYMESNGNNKNIDLARNYTDCETQTELNTSTTFSSIYDTPPPEQFDAKSPEMPQNKYLSITNNTITDCMQNDVTCEMQQSTSESDKDILSDMENVENSDADNEHSNTNELFKNINDDNSKDDYESVEYSSSPLNHGNANSVNGEIITHEELVSVQTENDTLIKESSSGSDLKLLIHKVTSMADEEFHAVSKNNQIINEQPLVVMENNNEQAESIESSTENHVILDEVDHNCATNSPDNHQAEDLISTEQVDVVESPEGNDVHAVPLNNVKNVEAKISSDNGLTLLDDRKIELADSTQNEESTVKSPLKVMYTSPKIITKNFYDFERIYCTFKDAFSGPVTKLNGMPHTNSKLNTVDTIQQPVSNGLTIKGQIVNGCSNTGTNSCSPPSSPNLSLCVDMDISDLRTDYETYLTNEAHLQSNVVVASKKPAKAQKRVAISVENNIIHQYQDARSMEDWNDIDAKRFRGNSKQDSKANITHKRKRKESNYIKKIRQRDQKLQMIPVVQVCLLNKDQLWAKFRQEIEDERLKQAVNCRKHNTTESRIKLKYFSPKDNSSTSDNSSSTGTVDLSHSFNEHNSIETTKVSIGNVLKNYDALNLTIPQPLNPLVPNSETSEEFSNSPKFLSDCNRIIENLKDEETQPRIKPGEESSTTSVNNFSFLSNNSNFYQCNDTLNNQLPKQVIDNNNVDIVKADDNFNDDNSEEIDILNLSNESELLSTLLKSIECESDSRLPFKKRRIPLPSKEDSKKEEISYPATPMISIAEVEALKNNKLNKAFKTPAERKEMPPLPSYSYNVNSESDSNVATDQFHNQSYSNPTTMNYQMTANVPIPFINIPCASYYPVTPILFPFNNGSVPNSLGGGTVHETAANKVASKVLQQQTKTGKSKNNVRREGLKENHLQFIGGYRAHNNI